MSNEQGLCPLLLRGGRGRLETPQRIFELEKQKLNPRERDVFVMEVIFYLEGRWMQERVDSEGSDGDSV